MELLANKLDCSLSYLINGVTAEQMEDIELALGYARLALENGEVAEARTRFAGSWETVTWQGLTARCVKTPSSGWPWPRRRAETLTRRSPSC